MKKKLPPLLLALFVLVVSAPFAFSQLNYTAAGVVNTTGAYADLGANGNVITTANFDDDNAAPQPIGFTFYFNGTAFTQFVLNTNGFIKLGNTAPSRTALYGSIISMDKGAIASSNPLDVNIIAALNANLQAGTLPPEYRVYTSGATGSKVCTIQFKNVRDKDSTVQFNNMNFQIKLYENTNIIELVFGKWEASTNAQIARFGSLGLKGTDSTTAQVVRSQKSSSSLWSAAVFLTNLTGNGHNFRNNMPPDSGRIYRFVPSALKVLLNNAAVCKGSCTTLTATPNSGTPPYTYSWNTGETIQTINSCPTANTSYTVSIVDSKGVSASASASVTVNPIPTITASGNSICAGGAGILSAAGGATYKWTEGAVTLSGGTVAVSPTVTTTYTVTGTSQAGCSNSATAVVSVNSLTAPVVVLSSVKDTICSGESVKVCATGANSYTWSAVPNATGADLSCTTCSCVTISRTGSAGSYKYILMGRDTVSGCVAKNDTVSLRVNANPTIVTAGSSVCQGTTGQMSASGASTYNWSAGTNPSTGTPVSATPTVTTTYTVTGTATTGCSATATARIVVTAPITITAGGNTICLGGTGILTAGGASTYTWTGGTTPTTGATVVASPAVTTTYSVTGASGGCSNSATAMITVKQQASPIITVNAKRDTICSGGSVQVCVTGASTYTWAPLSPAIPGDLSCINCSCVTISHTNTLSATYQYVVNGTDANGCVSKTDTVFLRMYALPTITASGSTICTGAAGQLNATGGATYTWSPGTNPANGASVVASPTVTTTYTVIGTSIRGCTGSSTATIFVNPGTAPILTTSWKRDTVCSGTPVQVCASGANTYTWTAIPNAIAGDISAKNAACTNLSHATTGLYRFTLVGTDTLSGCKSSMDTVFLYVNPIISITGSTICKGNSGTLSASGGTNYVWSAGTTPTTGPVVTAAPVVTTSYTVTVTSAKGCTGTARATIVVNALPTVTTSWVSDSVCLTSSKQICATGAVSYTWTAISPANASDISSPYTACTNLTEITAGLYKYAVRGIDAKGCLAKTDTVTLKGYSCNTGIKDHENSKLQFSAHMEDPSSSRIRFRYFSSGSENFTMEVYDVQGRIVFSHAYAKSPGMYENSITLSELQNQVLFILIRTKEESQVVKLVNIK